MTTKWKPSHQLDHDLRTNEVFVGMLVGFGEAIAERARAIAPVGSEDEGDDDPGSYRDGIEVQVRTGSTGRKRVAVVATDWKSILIEYGSIHNPAFGTLRKAARQSFGKGKHGLGAGSKVGRVRSTRKKK